MANYGRNNICYVPGMGSFLQLVGAFEFSEQETMLFIQCVPLDRLPAETAAKLKSLEINEDYRLLCRNLSMIIGRESCAR